MTKIEVDAEDFGFDVDLSPEAYVARQQKKAPALAQVKVEIVEGDGDEGGLGVAPVNIFDADYEPFGEGSFSRLSEKEAKDRLINKGGVELLHKPVEGIVFDHIGGLTKFVSPAPGVYNLPEPSDADAYTSEELDLPSVGADETAKTYDKTAPQVAPTVLAVDPEKSPAIKSVDMTLVENGGRAKTCEEAFGYFPDFANKLLAEWDPEKTLPPESITGGLDVSDIFKRNGSPTCFKGTAEQPTEDLLVEYKQRKLMKDLLYKKIQVDATIGIFVDTLKGPVETAKLPTSLPGGSLLKTILEEVKDRLVANKTIERAIIKELTAVLDDQDKLSLLFEQKSAVWHDTDKQAIAYILEFFRD